MTARFIADAEILSKAQPNPPRPTLRVLTCGSVDDSKSTLVGRLL